MIAVDASVLAVALADDGYDGDQARARLRGERLTAPELVDLEVTGTPAAREAGGAAERWQVLTVRGDRIADIRGFDDRAAAAARAGVPA